METKYKHYEAENNIALRPSDLDLHSLNGHRTGSRAYRTPQPSLVTPILHLPSTPTLNPYLSNETKLEDLTPGVLSEVLTFSTPLVQKLYPNNNINDGTECNNNNSNPSNSNNNISNNQNQNNNSPSNNKNNRSLRQRTSPLNKQPKQEPAFDDKIEKKRERNRLAAKKCRQRKVETIEELTKAVNQWEQKYNQLEKANETLRRKIDELNAQLNRQM